VHIIQHALKLHKGSWRTVGIEDGKYLIVYMYDEVHRQTFEVDKQVYTLLKNLENESGKEKPNTNSSETS
jgi:hypothetical protein